MNRKVCSWTPVIMIVMVFCPALSLSAQDFTGTYISDDDGVYYMQQVGNTVWWAGLSLDRKLPADYVWHRGLHFTNVFRGTIDSANQTISGEWADVSRGLTLSTGTLTLSYTLANGVPAQVIKTSATGGFGATTWTREPNGVLDDTLFNGKTTDIYTRFDAIRKNNADLFCIYFCGSNSTLLDNLKPYRDQTVVYGRLMPQHPVFNVVVDPNTNLILTTYWDTESEPPHVNYGPKYTSDIPGFLNFGHKDRDKQTFVCYDELDGDFDLRLKLDMNKLEPHFYDTGWGNFVDGATIFFQKFNDPGAQQALGFSSSEAYLGMESIMYGSVGTCDNLFDQTYGFADLLPGWGDLWSASLLINGRPLNGNLAGPQTDNCDFIQPCPFADPSTPLNSGIQIRNLLLAANGDGKYPPGPGNGTYVRVTGTLSLDCGHGISHPCFDDTGDVPEMQENPNQEIHPIYSIDIINHPFRPEDTDSARSNLTGAWGGTDGSTYYVRQIGNTIWWLGMMRDRQPIERGNAVDIIGVPQVAAAQLLVGSPNCPLGSECWMFANVFKGTITNNTDGSATIHGDWAGVPQSTSPGSTGSTGVTFTLNANRKLITPITLAGMFPDKLEKLYEPEDATPPSSTLKVGNPQYPMGSNQPFITTSTPLTVSSSDDASGVQNIWYRISPQGATPPGYAWTLGSSASFTVTGSDGTYEINSYATDNAGNDETAQSLLVQLDNTPPLATIAAPTATQYGHSAAINLNYSVSDGSGSGVNSATPKMDGLTGTQFGASLETGQTIYLYSMALGSHTFSVDSLDNLNNAGTNSVNFTIAVTPDSLKGDVTNLQALGCIDSIAQSLIAKISAAQNLIAKGQIQAAINILSATIYEVQAQAGKHISTACKDPANRAFDPVQLLLGDLQYMQTSLAAQLKPDVVMGFVQSATGAPIYGATVNLMSSPKSIVSSAITDSAGFYYFADTSRLLPGGNYSIILTVPKGFKSSSPAAQPFLWSGTSVLGNFAVN